MLVSVFCCHLEPNMLTFLHVSLFGFFLLRSSKKVYIPSSKKVYVHFHKAPIYSLFKQGIWSKPGLILSIGSPLSASQGPSVRHQSEGYIDGSEVWRLSQSKSCFSLLWNKFCSLLLDSVTLFVPYERSTFAPVSPSAECTFETWWKKFQQYKKSGQKCVVMFALQVKSGSNEIFHQIRKRHDNI